MCANGTDLNWMHVYPEGVPKEKVRAGKPAKDNSNTMAVNQTRSVKDACDESGNKNDRKELDYKLQIFISREDRLWRPRARTFFGDEENAK